MKAYIVLNFLGVFALDENGRLVDSVLFPKDSTKILDKLDTSDLTIEEGELIRRLRKKKYTRFISSKKHDVYGFEPENIGERMFGKQFRQISKSLGFSDIELNKFLTDVDIQLMKRRIKESMKKDQIAIQAVNAIDEIDKSLNIFIARLREWYGLHFPEMLRTIEKHDKFAKIVSRYGLKDNIEEKELIALAKQSMGMDLSKDDEKILKEYASKIKDLYKLREQMEKYVDVVMKEIAPNFTALAGSLLAARLIALVGGLDKLAKKPSSTIQLLGAEKALFRYLRGRGKSPKYGILFQHPYIQQVHPKKKGKVARVLSSKLNIAVKMDYYGTKDKSKELRQDLEKIIKRIMVE